MLLWPEGSNIEGHLVHDSFYIQKEVWTSTWESNQLSSFWPSTSLEAVSGRLNEERLGENGRMLGVSRERERKRVCVCEDLSVPREEQRPGKVTPSQFTADEIEWTYR